MLSDTHAVVPIARHKFSVADYYAMLEAGILTEDSRVELIHGEIVAKSPIHPRHASKVDELSEQFRARLGERAIVRSQNPVRLGDESEPQPDIALLKRQEHRYKTSHPLPADVFLIVEVSDATLAYDRSVKANLYAGVGIAEVWIVNLAEQRLEVLRDPDQNDYRERRLLKAGEHISPLAFPEVSFAVQEILE
jgi:Uma2 family endonuclease